MTLGRFCGPRNLESDPVFRLSQAGHQLEIIHLETEDCECPNVQIQGIVARSWWMTKVLQIVYCSWSSVCIFWDFETQIIWKKTAFDTFFLDEIIVPLPWSCNLKISKITKKSSNKLRYFHHVPVVYHGTGTEASPPTFCRVNGDTAWPVSVSKTRRPVFGFKTCQWWSKRKLAPKKMRGVSCACKSGPFLRRYDHT